MPKTVESVWPAEWGELPEYLNSDEIETVIPILLQAIPVVLGPKRKSSHPWTPSAAVRLALHRYGYRRSGNRFEIFKDTRSSGVTHIFPESAATRNLDKFATACNHSSLQAARDLESSTDQSIAGIAVHVGIPERHPKYGAKELAEKLSDSVEQFAPKLKGTGAKGEENYFSFTKTYKPRHVRQNNSGTSAPVSGVSVKPENTVLTEPSGPAIPDALDDIENHRPEFEHLAPTEREAIVKSRIGQGRYREQMILLWEGCAVTGIKNRALLRASHAIPWRECEKNEQRVDPHNGLLLTPNLDHLFDRHLIGFDKSGCIKISSKLSDSERTKLGITEDMRLSKRKCECDFFIKTRQYLTEHLQHVE